MALYIVRIRANHERVPDEVVGIFSAATSSELAWLVDECTDVDDCEYARLPNGGIYWPSRAPKITDLRLVISDDNDGDEDEPKAALQDAKWMMTEETHAAILAGKLAFHKFTEADKP